MASYDVFLSHPSADKAAVESLARRLVDEAKLQPFLDKWHLVPGEAWQEALEEALDQSRACAVFIGPGGISPWEHEEMRAAIEQRVADLSFRVIPVLLPGAMRGERGRLPAFLSRATWVEFQHGLDDAEAFRRLVAGIKGLPPGRGPSEVLDGGICPYRGLQVFEESHAPFFFGRDAATDWLLNALRPPAGPGTGEGSKRRNRFLAVIGPSGSGKSSLVRAGLVPALRRGDLPGSQDWPLRVFKPGQRPLESLAVALSQLIGTSPDPAALPRLIDALAADQRQVHLTAQLAFSDAPPERVMVLVVDQFEEIFSLCSDEASRTAFINNLLYASAIEGGRMMVILTMRADFYGKCALYPDLAARLTDHQMLVSPPLIEELRQAIECPAQRVGLEFEPGLVDALLHDMQAAPGALPLLQHTLLELWERRRERFLTFAAYQEIGGIQGAIAHRAEAIYSNLDPTQQAVTRTVMLRLVQPGQDTEDTRRRATLAELLSDRDDGANIRWVIQQLTEVRLLTTDHAGQDGEVIDVAHEALIRGWPRLRGWIEENRAALQLQRRLSEAALEWERHQRDDSYLYRGLRLAEAEAWAKTGLPNLRERQFITAGSALRDSARQTRRITRLVSYTMGGVLGGAAGGLSGGVINYFLSQMSHPLVQVAGGTLLGGGFIGGIIGLGISLSGIWDEQQKQSPTIGGAVVGGIIGLFSGLAISGVTGAILGMLLGLVCGGLLAFSVEVGKLSRGLIYVALGGGLGLLAGLPLGLVMDNLQFGMLTGLGITLGLVLTAYRFEKRVH